MEQLDISEGRGEKKGVGAIEGKGDVLEGEWGRRGMEQVREREEDWNNLSLEPDIIVDLLYLQQHVNIQTINSR